jgi:hypothetical protein
MLFAYEPGNSPAAMVALFHLEEVVLEHHGLLKRLGLARDPEGSKATAGGGGGGDREGGGGAASRASPGKVSDR